MLNEAFLKLQRNATTENYGKTCMWYEASHCMLYVHTTRTCGVTDVTYGTEISMLWWEQGGCTAKVSLTKDITQRPLLTAVLFHMKQRYAAFSAA